MTEMALTTGQVIALGDGRLACPVGEVYEALDGLLDDNLMTHQLPRAGRFVEPFIVETCPWVTDLPELPDLEKVDDRGAVVYSWVEVISKMHGYEHTIPDLSGQWIHFNPLDELTAIIGDNID